MYRRQLTLICPHLLLGRGRTRWTDLTSRPYPGATVQHLRQCINQPDEPPSCTIFGTPIRFRNSEGSHRREEPLRSLQRYFHLNFVGADTPAATPARSWPARAMV